VWPRKPKLPPAVERELELRGLDAVRSFLAGQGSFPGAGTARDTRYRLGDVTLTRGNVEDWLNWKSSADSLWIKAGTIAAIAAAIFSFLAWLFPVN